MQITAMPENAIVHLSTSDTVQIIQITAMPENNLYDEEKDKMFK